MIHGIVGIAWIGTSFYFNWLDSRLDREIDKEGIVGNPAEKEQANEASQTSSE